MQLIKPGTKIDFMGRTRVFGGVSVGLVLLALVGIAARGFNWGIDFSGGTELQIRFDQQVATTEIRKTLVELGFDKNQVQPYGGPESHEYLVRVERITSLSDERVSRLREQALQHFGADKLHSLVFEPNAGDRIVFDFSVGKAAEPDPVVEDGGVAAASTPEQQLAADVAHADRVTGELTGQIHDFFVAQGIELRSHDEIEFGQLQDDRLEAVVYFKGVADRIVQAMTKAFGVACAPENAAKVCVNTGTCLDGQCTADNRRTDYVDSNVSKELRTDGLLAIIYALIGILIYIAVRFDFFFSPGAVVALVHDVAITMGVFAWTGMEFNLTTVAALPTIVGYSLNDTIVVYDRIRETVPADDQLKGELSDYVNRALNATLSRTLLTSLTTLLVIAALLLFATGVIKTFGIALLIGLLVGTYSSIFVASPVYLMLKKGMPTAR